jgi:hypothetical protein
VPQVRIQLFSRELGPGRKTVSYDDRSPFVSGLGDQFIESKGYKSLIARGLGSGSFSTGPIELGIPLAEAREASN